MTLVFEEQESDAPVEWLAAPGDVPIVSSALWVTERVLAGVDLVPLDADVVAAACTPTPEGSAAGPAGLDVASPA